jgi:hypothetical protein
MNYIRYDVPLYMPRIVSDDGYERLNKNDGFVIQNSALIILKEAERS